MGQWRYDCVIGVSVEVDSRQITKMLLRCSERKKERFISNQ